MMLQAESAESNKLKALLPQGTCYPSEQVKYDFICKFLQDPLAYQFILPMPPTYASFVVIRSTTSQNSFLYKMYHAPSRTFLLSAQDQTLSIGCNYLISKASVPAKDKFYVAKLRGNFSRSEFNLFDNGDNPERVKTRARRHLGLIRKEQVSIWNNKTASFSVVVPKSQSTETSFQGVRNYQPSEFVCLDSKSTPLGQENFEDDNKEVLSHYEEDKLPRYSKAVSLRSSSDLKSLAARKRSDTYYELDIGCPLTIVQGFGYLLALIDTQIL